MSAYRANGPTSIGDTGLNNTILGNVTMTNVTSAQGDLLYANGANFLTRIPIGAENTVLKSVSGIPTWTAVPSTARNGFSATKLEGTTFDDKEIIIDQWSIDPTMPFTINPFFNTGALDLSSGILTPTETATYYIHANIIFTNRVNEGTRTLNLCEVFGLSKREISDVDAPIHSVLITTGDVQAASDTNTEQYLTLNGVYVLSKDGKYAFTISSTTASQEISSKSKISIIYEAPPE